MDIMIRMDNAKFYIINDQFFSNRRGSKNELDVKTIVLLKFNNQIKSSE